MYGSEYGSGSGEFWLDNLQCNLNGTVNSLDECPGVSQLGNTQTNECALSGLSGNAAGFFCREGMFTSFLL